MKTRLNCVAGILAAVAAGVRAAHAQDVIDLTPDEEVLVDRYVQQIPEPPPVIEEHMTLRPGSVIPVGVPLQPFARVEALARLAYFISVDHKIVVADPRTRIVVRILSQKK